ncbi:MAG: hypothetical protein V4671_22325 [Armatimonadota bacterium]
MKSGPLIVQFGAGAIGRGFLAYLWTQGGCNVRFVDVDAVMVEALNRRGSYPIRITGDASPQRWVPRISAVLANDISTITLSLSACEFACTAVGVNSFSALAPVIAAGIAKRCDSLIEPVSEEERREHWQLHPLNVLCCENQKGAGSILREAVEQHLPDTVHVREFFQNHVAFVDASVGRMVPPPTPELLAEDSLLILAEPYAELPIDGNAWIGPVPPIPGLLPKTNFAGYVARKLFTHNGGHALLAYEGYQRGYEFIWQAAEDAELAAELRGYWNEVGAALIRAYGFPPDEQRRHEADLLQRFRNRALGDTVSRVGRDVARKVRPDDRLVGAALLCIDQGVEPEFASRAIAAAYAYDVTDDPTAPLIQQVIRSKGISVALAEYSQIDVSSPLASRIAAEYATMFSARP